MRIPPLQALFLSLFLLAASAVSAGVLKGTITDGKGAPLPFATVFVQGTTTGTAANASGVYQLPLAPGTYQIT